MLVSKRSITVVASCPWSWPGLTSCSLEPTVVNCPSLEYRNKALHILTLILQWVLPWVAHLAIGLRLLPLLVSLHRLLHSIPLGPHPSDLFYDPIHIFLVVFQTSFCWIDIWMVRYILVNLLGLSCLVSFQFPHCPIPYYLLLLLPWFFWSWIICFHVSLYNFLDILWTW